MRAVTAVQHRQAVRYAHGCVGLAAAAETFKQVAEGTYASASAEELFARAKALNKEGKYKKACKVNGGNFQDSVNWSATVNGEIIKSYCPWVWQETAHRKKYCKQMKNNVLVSTACPCACAGY